jgi:peptide-methionine (S)-S-oxide reductase
MQNIQRKVAVFAGGCFWCMEAVFSLFQGIESILPGYTGGLTENPRYDEVCTGDTGHAEAIKIIYNPNKISYLELLKIFFASHNPCTLNQQGADIGTQYRSAIFYTDEEQNVTADEYLKRLRQDHVFPSKITTELIPLKVFWPAEDYHHNYFEHHPDQAYCQISIKSKVDKIKKLQKTDFLGAKQ